MSDYPKKISLPDDAKVELRLMSQADRDAVLAFARSLPEEDLLFLSVDITRPEAVDGWLANLEAGETASLVAYDDEGLIGYATVQRSPTRWTRRVGEIRVNVGPGYRGRGLGRVLTSEIFDVARGLGVKKLIANMTVDQRGAQAAFRRLGFVAEALLPDHVEDRNGRFRDLVMMSYAIDGHSETAEDRVRI